MGAAESQGLGLESQPLRAGQPYPLPGVSLGCIPSLSLPFPAPSVFLGNSLRKSPAGEGLMWDIYIWGPPSMPHNPTTRATPYRARCPGPQPPTIQQADPHHHTGFIGSESHRGNPKGAPCPLTPKSVQGPGGWLSVHHSNLGFLSQLSSACQAWVL